MGGGSTALANSSTDLAAALGKPLIVEEFGISRDGNSHEAAAPLHVRDHFYATIFDEVVRQSQRKRPLVGANFWAWGGEGRPREPRAPGTALTASHCWQPHDPLLGDPPHEGAGWYSVYDTDTSTHDVLRSCSKRFAVGAFAQWRGAHKKRGESGEERALEPTRA